MKGKYEQVPAKADAWIDQALIDMGVKFYEVVPRKDLDKPQDGKLEQAVKKELDPYVKRMIGGVKCVGLCAGLGLVVLWWMKAGFLAPAAAWPAFLVISLLTGVGLGRCLGRR